MRDQRGLASVVTVTVMIVLITLISLGFARIMDRSAQNSRNNQSSNAATYAAQSAINDVSTFIKTNATAYSSQCTGNNSLIGSSGNPGPFYNDSNLSGDSTRNTQYTCILLNQTPTDLMYQALPVNQSRIVKMTTSAFTGALDKLMISWQPTNSNVNGFPPNTTSLYDETTWNDTSHNYVPILRVTIYPVPVGGGLSNLQSNSRTVFLYPRQTGGLVPIQSYPAISDGSIIPVNCTNNVPGGAFDGTADYTCNIIINSLSTSTLPDKLDYLYLRISPVYNQADVKLKTNDMWGQQLKFIGVQALVDVTAKSSDVAKRLQARVDIGGNPTPGANDDNISPGSNNAPEFSLRSANALCKRFLNYASYYSYTQIDGPKQICARGTASVYTPAPTLALSITGNNGTDSGVTVDSQAANPDSPQNPQQYGTVYLNRPGSAKINWTSTDAAYNCNASGGVSGWPGDKNPSSSWTNVTGTGSQTFTGNIYTVTGFSMQCNGPGGTSPARTVYAWPLPNVSISGPGSYHAGTSYTISWSSTNATRCQVSSSGNQSWNQSYGSVNQYGAGDSRTFYTSWDDNSAKTYTITCWDPIGRSGSSGSASWTVGGGGGTTILPPVCHAWTNVVDNGNGTGYPQWNGSCDNVPISSTMFYIYSSTDPSWNGWVGNAANATWMQVGTGNHCIGLRVGPNATWSFPQQDSGQACRNIQPPPLNLGGWISYNGFNNGECSTAWPGISQMWVICGQYFASENNPDPSSYLYCLTTGGGASIWAWGPNPSGNHTIGAVYSGSGGSYNIDCYDNFGQHRHFGTNVPGPTGNISPN